MIAPPHAVTLVPPMKYKNSDVEAKGKKRYDAQKASRNQASDNLNVSRYQTLFQYVYVSDYDCRLRCFLKHF